MNPEDFREKQSGLGSAPRPGAPAMGSRQVEPAARAINADAESPAIGIGERVAQDVKETVSSSVDYRKRQAADVVDGLADAVRHVGTEQAQGTRFKTYADNAAAQLERLAEGIRSKGPADLVRELRTVARRQPALFIGGAFVAGLAVARFLKSSDGDEYAGSSRSNYRGSDETGRGPSWTA